MLEKIFSFHKRASASGASGPERSAPPAAEVKPASPRGDDRLDETRLPAESAATHPTRAGKKILAIGLSLALAFGSLVGPMQAARDAAEAAMDEPPAPVVEEVTVNNVDPAYHTVVHGDTWKSVGYQFGIPQKALKDANPGASATLKPGTKILLPDPAPGQWKYQNPPQDYVHQTIREVAQARGIPPKILEAVAWQESGWRQWQPDGSVTEHVNPAKKSRPASTDYGIAQINEHFHPDAFPSAKYSFKYNLNVAALVLRADYQETGDWNQALTHYNGSGAYPKKVQHLENQQPWARIEEERDADDEPEESEDPKA